MKEVWKPLPGYPHYQVSNLGQVKGPGGRNQDNSKILKQELHWKGYLRVKLSLNGKTKNARVHRLVLEAFVGPSPDGCDCDHINEIKTDNRLENLRWFPKDQNGERSSRWRRKNE